MRYRMSELITKLEIEERKKQKALELYERRRQFKEKELEK